ncbi:hypothetical protein D9M70_405400 [compost metagenome]
MEKKPRLRITMRRSSSVRPSGFFQRAMSAVMLTSCGIQWFAQPSRYFCQAQSYLKGTSWLRSARQLIMRFSSTATRAEAPSSSARPSATSRESRAALARATAAESAAVTARASRAAAPPALSRRSMLASVAWPALALLTATSVSSLSNSSQLSMTCRLLREGQCARVKLDRSVFHTALLAALDLKESFFAAAIRRHQTEFCTGFREPLMGAASVDRLCGASDWLFVPVREYCRPV